MPCGIVKSSNLLARMLTFGMAESGVLSGRYAFKLSIWDRTPFSTVKSSDLTMTCEQGDCLNKCGWRWWCSLEYQLLCGSRPAPMWWKAGNSFTSSVSWRVPPALCHCKATDDGAGKLTFRWLNLSSTLWDGGFLLGRNSHTLHDGHELPRGPGHRLWSGK